VQIRANKGLNAKSSRLSVQVDRGRSTLYFKYIESGIKIRQAGSDDGHGVAQAYVSESRRGAGRTFRMLLANSQAVQASYRNRRFPGTSSCGLQPKPA
jgi:hypothetical protein